MLLTLVFAVPVLAAVLFYLFLQQPQFGKQPTGARRARILQSPNYRDGKFQNLSFTPDLAEGVTYWDMIKLLFRGSAGPGPTAPLPSVKTDLRQHPAFGPSLVWFGHSSYLLQLDGRNILVDPVFSANAAPVSFFGRRFPGSDAYSAADMPDIDVLLLTHDHYDHLDYPTLRQLRPRVKQVVTSLGVGAHLEHWGFAPDVIHELDWHEKIDLGAGLSFQALPARHFSGRQFKRAQTLWSAFILQTDTLRLFLGGDSGYDTHFKTIGEQYGPFDFALLECGQYFKYWINIHTLPEETAQAAIDLKARAFMPVHWGAFSLAPHAWNEPIGRVTRKAAELGLTMATPMIGERVVLGGAYPAERWWEGVKMNIQ